MSSKMLTCESIKTDPNFKRLPLAFSKDTRVGDYIFWDNGAGNLYRVEKVRGKSYLSVDLRNIKSGKLFIDRLYTPSKTVYQFRGKSSLFSDEELSDIFV